MNLLQVDSLAYVWYEGAGSDARDGHVSKSGQWFGPCDQNPDARATPSFTTGVTLTARALRIKSERPGKGQRGMAPPPDGASSSISRSGRNPPPGLEEEQREERALSSTAQSQRLGQARDDRPGTGLREMAASWATTFVRKRKPS